MKFPNGFLWGTATAAHQVEGGNTNCDSWLLEHLDSTVYTESSGDACDHYHRYADDMALLARLGFKRLSILDRMGTESNPQRGSFRSPSLNTTWADARGLPGKRTQGGRDAASFHLATMACRARRMGIAGNRAAFRALLRTRRWRPRRCGRRGLHAQ